MNYETLSCVACYLNNPCIVSIAIIACFCHAIPMTSITKLTAASVGNSLRSTVPSRIVQELGLSTDSYLKWDIVHEGGHTYVRVEPVG